MLETSGHPIIVMQPMDMDYPQFWMEPMVPTISWFMALIRDGHGLSTSAGQHYIGRGTPGYQNLNGDVAEFVVFTSTLSDADRDRVHGYLAHKWGLNRIHSGWKSLQNHCSACLHQSSFLLEGHISAPIMICGSSSEMAYLRLTLAH